jgi:NAD(P)-dependent dehydrogenase (short-subunit alcohol dehydrogenase family)
LLVVARKGVSQSQSGKIREVAMGTEIFSLNGKVAVITGSGRSIGKGIALCMAEAGADIVVTARTQAQIDETVAEIKSKGRRALGVQFDARDADQVKALAGKAVAEFGRIDIWVNNVGTPTHWDNIDMTDSGWDAMLKENLKTTFLGCQVAGKLMREKNIKGSIINISTTSTRPGAGGEGSPAYSAAKSGVNSLTTTFALALAPYGIRVNCVVPGQTLHPVSMVYSNFKDPEVRAAAEGRVPLGRLGTPEDIGWACVYLSSDAASYVTGDILSVSGGR